MRAITPVLAATFLSLASPSGADEFERLMDALRMDEVVDILVEEGTSSALEIEASMFPDRGGAAWADEVARIYDADLRSAQIKGVMEDIMSADALPPVLAFLESERGARIMTLEVTARRAFIDPDMEEVALEIFADAETEHAELFANVMEFIEVNDLIDQNVEGAFTANFAFAQGATNAGAFAGLSAAQLAAQMWAGEEAVAADVEQWMFAYLMTAYSPLESSDLEAYIALSRTEAGQTLNQAIMDSFGALFEDISYDVGAAAGRFMAQQDI
ncbi:MAG: hypothetical protein AAF092_12230 [Pseudomonadota bacterium]